MMYQPIAYAYNAAFICPDCADQIMAELPAPDYPEPWDTDEWPYPVFEPSDVAGECCDRMEGCVNRETRYRRGPGGRFAGGVYRVGCRLAE